MPARAAAKPKGPSLAVPASPSMKAARRSKITKQRGASSNYYLARLLERGVENLSDDEQQEVALLIKASHRITPVATSKAGAGKTVFNSVTGHHEWLPTDRALQIVRSTKIWAGFYTNLRSPTWLLVLNPDNFCIDRTAYVAALTAAAGAVRARTGKTIPASSLGLVGHSGGLSHKGTQLTTHQSTWHDQLRDLYDLHAPSNNYDAYWVDLQKFIGDNFLFSASPTLPTCGVDLAGMSNDDLMKAITWDLDLSGRGNPDDAGSIETLHDVAQFLHAQWNTWGQYLANSFQAWRNA